MPKWRQQCQTFFFNSRIFLWCLSNSLAQYVISLSTLTSVPWYKTVLSPTTLIRMTSLNCLSTSVVIRMGLLTKAIYSFQKLIDYPHSRSIWNIWEKDKSMVEQQLQRFNKISCKVKLNHTLKSQDLLLFVGKLCQLPQLYGNWFHLPLANFVSLK